MPIVESHYELMHPGRFLRASDLRGQTVTVEIADINAEDMEGDDKKIEREYILSFKGKDKQLMINKTNSYLIAKILGKNPNEWRGHKIALYPTTTRFGRDTVECIRVWGSPEITQDIKIATRMGKQPLKTTLHAMNGTATKPAAKPVENPSTKPQSTPDSNVLDAWTMLGWTHEEGDKDLMQWENSDRSISYLAHLNKLIDEENAREAQ